MLKINSYNTVPFMAKNTEPAQNNKDLMLTAGCIAGTLILGLGVSKLTMKNLTKVLKQQGIELQNDIAIIKETGKKYTGEVSVRAGTFGFAKEIFKFEDGIICEKLFYDCCGKEKNGNFYDKNGNLLLSISGKQGKKNTYYGYSTFDKKQISAEGRLDGEKSIFEYARGIFKNLLKENA